MNSTPHVRMLALMPVNVRDHTLEAHLLSGTFDSVSRCPLYTCLDTRINAP